MTANVKQMTEQAGNEALLLAAGNQSIETLRNFFGPTVGCSVSRCRNGGYVVLTGNVIHAACTDAWEAKEIVGELMAAEFGVSVTQPEHARNVTPADHQDEQIPPGVRPDMPHGGNVVEPRVRAWKPESVQLVLMAAIVGLRGIVGV